MLAILAPGQGAQKSGFLQPWTESASFARGLDWYSAVTGIDLTHLGTEADDETIRDTAIAQPLLVAAGALALAELFGSASLVADDLGEQVVVAGHSVGEITAAIATGVVSPETGMVLVRERGRAMAEAAAVRPTSMTAVLAGDPDEVLAKIEAAGLTPANNNGPGQVVAAGTVEQLEAFAADPPNRARLAPLQVAGAFHTVHMEPAVSHLSSVAAAAPVADPQLRLLSNRDGAAVSEGRDALDRIVAQVANPVRWDLCLQTLADLGVTGVLEVPPAGTLAGIAKRHLRSAERFTLNTPDQLDEARAFVRAHV
ncbi:MAG TPA: ACP S-malonyltransferase [Candidatus Avipropionibacterium avicola]|uniref:[acyl-carrier-protein] S-malonyltransferase n=1 Tax=Candidatus Avipropionibacterium avicola TaxID=2840701 RepID=A0A9D1GXY2_9ACTN|nr:ACP S-malonyltransferase [Candidatus Avipropionibacterium avicola]